MSEREEREGKADGRPKGWTVCDFTGVVGDDGFSATLHIPRVAILVILEFNCLLGRTTTYYIVVVSAVCR